VGQISTDLSVQTVWLHKTKPDRFHQFLIKPVGFHVAYNNNVIGPNRLVAQNQTRPVPSVFDKTGSITF
jgi:hypothetical protein